MTEKERQDTKMATLYEIRLILTNGNKKEYTLEELCELLDKIAMAKEQEQGWGGEAPAGIQGLFCDFQLNVYRALSKTEFTNSFPVHFINGREIFLQIILRFATHYT